MKNFKIYKLIFEGIISIFAITISLLNIWIKIPYLYIFSIIMMISSTLLVFGLEINYFKVYKQIKTFDFSMDFLIAIATHITYLYSMVMWIITIINKGILFINLEFFEVSYTLSFFIGMGHIIEDKMKRKTSLGIKELLKLQNKNVWVKENESEEFINVKTNTTKIGDIIRVSKGESIPTDGILLSKDALIDYSSLLGEPIPKQIYQNQNILSGSINVGETLIYKATKSANDSTLLKIVSQLENIMDNKTKIERISQKIVKYFLPTILSISLLTFIIWVILGYQNIVLPTIFTKNFNDPITNAIYHAVATLVISCPCAFGIATPIAIYSSSSIASKNKILFSSPKIYEMINKIKYLAFDKTGTLTSGKPEIIEYYKIEDVNHYIYELTANSNHPISKSINEYLLKNKDNSKVKFDLVKEISGIGVVGKIKNNEYALVSYKYAIQNKFNFNQIKKDNEISTIFAINNNVIAYFKIDDLIKNDAYETIRKLHAMNLELILISGDSNSKVKKIAKELKIDHWYANKLPNEKSKIIDEYKKLGNIIFVGDGVNDILAIKNADIGIAYASGSEITNSVADISLIENDLNLVYKVIILTKRTIKLIKLNFSWASIFNILAIPLAIIGFIPPWLGALLMVCSTTVLLSNTLFFQARNKKLINNT